MKKLFTLAFASLVFAGATYACGDGKKCGDKEKACCKKEAKKDCKKKCDKEAKKDDKTATVTPAPAPATDKKN